MFKGFVLGIVVVIVAAAACAYIVLVTGTVPAAANGKPLPLEQWAARTSLRATLAKSAPTGPNPVPLTDANLIAGIELYEKHCAICHGTAKGDQSASRWPRANSRCPRNWRRMALRTIPKDGPFGKSRTAFAGPACPPGTRH